MKYQKGTFSITPNKDHMKYKASEMQTIFFWLCEHADENGRCYPARRTLAKEAGCGLKSLDKYLEQLAEEGFISKETRSKPGTKEMMSNMYQVLIMPHLVSKKDKPGSKNDTTPSSISDSVTIPTINYTHLTVFEDVPSEPVQEEVRESTIEEARERGELPSRFGKTSSLRLLNAYRRFYMHHFGKEYKVLEWPKTLAKAKRFLEGKTERQALVLLDLYFGYSDRIQDASLERKMFPLDLFYFQEESLVNKFRLMDVYDYDSPEKVSRYIREHLQEIVK